MEHQFSKEVVLEKARNLIADFLSMPYYKNFASASGAVHNITNHEDAVKVVLEKNGLVAADIPMNKVIVSDWLNNPSNATIMPVMSFVSQPCGTQGNPDFLVKLENGVVFALECKSSNAYSPMYNSGGIKQNTIYLLCSSKTNKTTIYVGRDIMTIAQQNLITELIQKQKVLEKEYNEKLRLIDVRHRGVSYGTRPAIQQSGDASYTNYFTHSEREMCEKNVDNFIGEIINSAYLDNEINPSQASIDVNWENGF